MKRYEVTLKAITDLLMHRDNIEGSERLVAWRRANKSISIPGDDRSPAMTWMTYLYEDGGEVGLPSDNLMTMFRDGGKKMPAAKGKGSLKGITQCGLHVDQLSWPLIVNGRKILVESIAPLESNLDFEAHMEGVKKLGFELLVKRATVGTAKHIRVRPRFRNWSATGTITVTDPQITPAVLTELLTVAGSTCGICDWRPGAPKAPGPYGRFTATVKEVA